MNDLIRPTCGMFEYSDHGVTLDGVLVDREGYLQQVHFACRVAVKIYQYLTTMTSLLEAILATNRYRYTWIDEVISTIRTSKIRGVFISC